MVCPACLIALAGTDGIGAYDATAFEYAAPIGLAVIGAGIGALIGKKNRKKGALLGLLAGGTVGTGIAVALYVSAKSAPAQATNQQDLTQQAASFSLPARMIQNIVSLATSGGQEQYAAQASRPTTSAASATSSSGGGLDPNEIFMSLGKGASTAVAPTTTTAPAAPAWTPLVKTGKSTTVQDSGPIKMFNI